MDGNLEISIDKLPVKRLESIEENGAERFPTDVGYDEKRVSLIRRIDFAWALEREEDEKKKKQKKSKQSTSATQWPWQGMVENLQLAHQELSVIIDLIQTVRLTVSLVQLQVEANDAVTVAGMTRPKLFPNEHLADLAVSTATKLQCYRQLGKYFKQSAKALDEQVARETRFYGALIRLQQNWKVKRQRQAAITPGNEGFTFDLYDNSLYDPSVVRPTSLSIIRIDRDPAGMLAINFPPKSLHSLHFGFLGLRSNAGGKTSIKGRSTPSIECVSKENEKEPLNDNESVKATNLLLREVHQAIFDEQVFDLVNREAVNQSVGVNITGIRENYLQLNIGPGASVFVSLTPCDQDESTVDGQTPKDLVCAALTLDSKMDQDVERNPSFPNSTSYEIFLQQIFHEHVLVKAKEKSVSTGTHVTSILAKEGSSLLSHFCLSLSHRITSNKVLIELEEVVCRVPYLHLISHPTWHSRASSWTVFIRVPQTVLHANSQLQASDIQSKKNSIKSEFRNKVIVNDNGIHVEAEGAPNVVGLFNGSSKDRCMSNKYDCDLVDLPVLILQQVASQVIRWLHGEALAVGMKASRDFLCLSFELDQGGIVSLVAHVDPEDTEGCISWWMVMEEGFSEERKLYADAGADVSSSEYKKFLGYLTLDVLYSTLMDMVSLCSGGGSHR
ncbi:Mediator of RNA polymerase II transcription subunit 17 [Linum perenne]